MCLKTIPLKLRGVFNIGKMFLIYFAFISLGAHAIDLKRTNIESDRNVEKSSQSLISSNSINNDIENGSYVKLVEVKNVTYSNKNNDDSNKATLNNKLTEMSNTVYSTSNRDENDKIVRENLRITIRKHSNLNNAYNNKTNKEVANEGGTENINIQYNPQENLKMTQRASTNQVVKVIDTIKDADFVDHTMMKVFNVDEVIPNSQDYLTNLIDIVHEKNRLNMESFWILFNQDAYHDDIETTKLSNKGGLLTLLSIFTKLKEAQEMGASLDQMIDCIIKTLSVSQYDLTVKRNEFTKSINSCVDCPTTYAGTERDNLKLPTLFPDLPFTATTFTSDRNKIYQTGNTIKIGQIYQNSNKKSEPVNELRKLKALEVTSHDSNASDDLKLWIIDHPYEYPLNTDKRQKQSINDHESNSSANVYNPQSNYLVSDNEKSVQIDNIPPNIQEYLKVTVNPYNEIYNPNKNSEPVNELPKLKELKITSDDSNAFDDIKLWITDHPYGSPLNTDKLQKQSINDHESNSSANVYNLQSNYLVSDNEKSVQIDNIPPNIQDYLKVTVNPYNEIYNPLLDEPFFNLHVVTDDSFIKPNVHITDSTPYINKELKPPVAENSHVLPNYLYPGISQKGKTSDYVTNDKLAYTLEENKPIPEFKEPTFWPYLIKILKGIDFSTNIRDNSRTNEGIKPIHDKTVILPYGFYPSISYNGDKKANIVPHNKLSHILQLGVKESNAVLKNPKLLKQFIEMLSRFGFSSNVIKMMDLKQNTNNEIKPYYITENSIFLPKQPCPGTTHYGNIKTGFIPSNKLAYISRHLDNNKPIPELQESDPDSWLYSNKLQSKIHVNSSPSPNTNDKINSEYIDILPNKFYPGISIDGAKEVNNDLDSNFANILSHLVVEEPNPGTKETLETNEELTINQNIAKNTAENFILSTNQMRPKHNVHENSIDDVFTENIYFKDLNQRFSDSAREPNRILLNPSIKKLRESNENGHKYNYVLPIHYKPGTQSEGQYLNVNMLKFESSNHIPHWYSELFSYMNSDTGNKINQPQLNQPESFNDMKFNYVNNPYKDTLSADIRDKQTIIRPQERGGS